MKINLLDAVEESFSIYAAMTIQDRAIVDARDGLKPAPRQCMYAQYLDKITYKKPFKKSAKSGPASKTASKQPPKRARKDETRKDEK